MPLSQREFLAENASLRARETAIRDVDGESLTYADFEARVECLAAALADRGLRPGDRLALVLDNDVEFPVTTYACHALGLVAVPINYRLSSGEVRTILDDANAQAIVYDADYADTVEPAVESSRRERTPIRVSDGGDVGGSGGPDSVEQYDNVIRSGGPDGVQSGERAPTDPSYIIYTSGTTGLPKGVVHTVRSARERTLAAIVSFDVDPDSVVLSQLPFFHGGGLDAAMRATLTIGAELVVAADYAAPEATLERIERLGVTHVVGIPTVTRRILEGADPDAYDLSSIECWYHTGEVMPERRARRFREELTPNVINSYGSSEGGFITVLRSDDLTEQAGSVGRPTLGTRIRVVDVDLDGRADPDRTVARGEEGEVILHSDQLFAEYFRNPEATAEAFDDGWYYTNDLGFLDEDGFLTITGRVDDVIISGGELIAPVDVEDALESHPAVHEAVAVGEPDEEWGERVVAVVATHEGESVTAEELDDHCRTGTDLADYKRPRDYRFVDAIEHTESGKKSRAAYRE